MDSRAAGKELGWKAETSLRDLCRMMVESDIRLAEREKHLQLYLKKHPYLEEFVTAPTCALIRVKVEKYILVTQFQEVREIYPTP